MKHHFIISYAGNKRQEVEHLHDFLEDKLEGIDTIIEPFCGTSAMSVSLSIKYPKRFKYIINDYDDKLIELYNIMNDADKLKRFTDEFNAKVKLLVDKEAYNSIVKDGSFMGWFVGKKIYQIRSGLYPVSRGDFTKKIYDFNDLPVIKFLRTESVEIRCGDGADIVKQYQENQKCLLLIDPPYIMSCNLFYTSKETNIYEYCVDVGLGNMKSMVVLVLEDFWIIKMMFKGFIKNSYAKTYAMKQKKTSHIIISNR